MNKPGRVVLAGPDAGTLTPSPDTRGLVHPHAGVRFVATLPALNLGTVRCRRGRGNPPSPQPGPNARMSPDGLAAPCPAPAHVVRLDRCPHSTRPGPRAGADRSAGFADAAGPPGGRRVPWLRQPARDPPVDEPHRRHARRLHVLPPVRAPYLGACGSRAHG